MRRSRLVHLTLAAALVPGIASAQTTTPAAPAVAQAVVPSSEAMGPVSAPDGSLRYVFGGGTEPLLTCRPLYVCDVILESGETILNLGIGDSARWVVAAAQSGPGGATPHVLIKPTALDLATNLIVTTTKRVYYVRLASAANAPNPRISYSYPEEAQEEAAARALEAKRREDERASELPLLPPDQLDSAYYISGEKTFAPSRVYNDGVHTFIEYVTLPNDLPVVYAVESDGTNQIVNFRLKDSKFIVDGTPSGMDLVLNAGTGKHGHGERRVHIRHK
jgi:type IV secretion system protein VirB9